MNKDTEAVGYSLEAENNWGWPYYLSSRRKTCKTYEWFIKVAKPISDERCFVLWMFGNVRGKCKRRYSPWLASMSHVAPFKGIPKGIPYYVQL